MEISLAAGELFKIGKFPITNSLLTCFLVMIFLITLSFFGTRVIRRIPQGLQNFLEIIIESLFNLFDSVTQDRKLTKKFFPLVATIFIFVIMSNWTEILPGVGSIGIKHEKESEEISRESSFYPVSQSNFLLSKIISDLYKIEKAEAKNEETKVTGEGVTNESGKSKEESKEEQKKDITPFLRSPSSDLNFTLALAIISVLSIQISGIVLVGFSKYTKKFINFSGPIKFFVGILELISEIAKLISFSLRLFGNIFAGKVLLLVIAFLVPIIAPIPFYLLEIFVGFVQALIFSMLTLVFLTMAAKAEEH
jgi:F-type H+-transporting ATPase subunit a